MKETKKKPNKIVDHGMAEWKMGFSLCKQRNRKLEKGEVKILRKFAVTGDVRGNNTWLPASPPLVSLSEEVPCGLYYLPVSAWS